MSQAEFVVLGGEGDGESATAGVDVEGGTGAAVVTVADAVAGAAVSS